MVMFMVLQTMRVSIGIRNYGSRSSSEFRARMPGVGREGMTQPFRSEAEMQGGRREVGDHLRVEIPARRHDVGAGDAPMPMDRGAPAERDLLPKELPQWRPGTVRYLTRA